MKYLIQAIGIIAGAFAILAFQAKKHKNIMILKGLDSIFFAVQWALLKDFTSMALTIISIVRNLSFGFLGEKNINFIPFIIGFVIANTVAGILTYYHWTCILKTLATVITTISFGLKKEFLVRLFTIPACILGVVHAVMPIHFSVGGIITESFTIISIIIAIIRFRKVKPKDLPNNAVN